MHSKINKQFLLGFFFLFVFHTHLCAQTTVLSDITADQTWGAGIHLITGDIAIHPEATVTISAGAFVILQAGNLTVNGKLVVNGASFNMVTFSSVDSYVINFNSLQESDLSYANFDAGMVSITNSTVNMTEVVGLEGLVLSQAILNYDGTVGKLSLNAATSTVQSVINATGNVEFTDYTVPQGSTLNLVAKTGKNVNAEIGTGATNAITVHGEFNSSSEDASNTIQFNLSTVNAVVNFANAGTGHIKDFACTSVTPPDVFFEVSSTNEVKFTNGDITAGAMLFLEATNSGAIVIDNCEFDTHDDFDEVIYTTNASAITITNSKFETNAGSIYIDSEGNNHLVTFRGNTFDTNLTNGYIFDSDITIENCTMQGRKTSFALVDCQGVFTKNIVTDFNESITIVPLSVMFLPTIEIEGTSGKLEISKNTFTNNASVRGGALCISETSGDITIHSNIFDANVAAEKGGAVYAQNSSLKILNNVFYANSSVLAPAIYAEVSDVVILNSIFWGNVNTNTFTTEKQIYIHAGVDVPVITNNVIEDKNFVVFPTFDYSASINTNTSNDPLFTDPAMGDFTLQDNSPCVNAGNSDLSLITWSTDLAGNARAYHNTNVDMGAYETSLDINAIDIQVLEEIYVATAGANWTQKTNWLDRSKVSEWYGVTIEKGRVSGIELEDNNLVGTIPNSISHLSDLEVFNVAENSISLVSSDIKYNEKLREVDLSFNQLSEMPDLSSNTFFQLEKFAVHENNMTISDLLPNYQLANFIYTPQHELAQTPSSVSITNGEGKTLEMTGVMSAPNDIVYTWYRNNVQVQKSASNSYAISEASSNDIGSYVCGATHRKLPLFELKRSAINVTVSEAWANKTDSLALVEIYNSCNGSKWTNSSGWLTEPIKNWYGISLEEGRVVGIALGVNNLDGELPEAINGLSELETMDFSVNELAGNLNVDLEQLSELKELKLANNQLFGEFPTVPVGHAISEIDLSENKLSGSLTSDLGNATELVELSIASNQFNGALPTSITNLSKLRTLNISDNVFYGVTTADFSSFYELEYLDMSKNDLSGSFPTGIASPKLRELNLASNDFDGVLPDSWVVFSKLNLIDLSNNNFSGNIPSGISELSELEELRLNSNAFSSEIPISIGNLKKLKYLILDHNQLSGSIPQQLENLTQLIEMELGFNKISGSIPEIFQSMIFLQKLSIDNNELTGSIPAQLGELFRLKQLSIYANKLTGNVPRELGYLTFLEILEINKNELSGELPMELGYLESLRTLSIRSNQFTGRIPDSFENLKQLERWYMYDNQFTGIPDLTKLKNLEALQIFNNWIEFGDIIPNINVCEDFQYAPQRDYKEVISVAMGVSVTIGKEITGGDNEYTWLKDLKLLSHDQAFYELPAEEGIYQLLITNEGAGDLVYLYTCEIVTDPITPKVSSPEPYCSGDLNVHLENSDSVPLWWYWDKELTDLIDVEQPSNHIDIDIETTHATIYVVNKVGSKVSEVVPVVIVKRPSLEVNDGVFSASTVAEAEYKWYFNDQFISSEASITPTENGRYVVTASLNGCSSSSDVVNWLNGEVVSTPKQMQAAVSLFPNPTIDRLQVSLQNSLMGSWNVSIRAANGVEVKNFDYKKTSHEMRLVLPVSNLVQGKYFCILRHGTTTIVKQFVKM